MRTLSMRSIVIGRSTVPVQYPPAAELINLTGTEAFLNEDEYLVPVIENDPLLRECLSLIMNLCCASYQAPISIYLCGEVFRDALCLAESGRSMPRGVRGSNKNLMRDVSSSSPDALDFGLAHARSFEFRILFGHLPVAAWS